MAKATGFDRYECDRANYHKDEGGKVEYLASTDSRKDDWHEIQRVRADGTTISRWLCAECYGKSKTLAEEQDRTFNNFMDEAKGA